MTINAYARQVANIFDLLSETLKNDPKLFANRVQCAIGESQCDDITLPLPEACFPTLRAAGQLALPEQKEKAQELLTTARSAAQTFLIENQFIRPTAAAEALVA